MKDKFSREITYLRISVTDLCNLRCVYCMPEEGIPKLRNSDLLRFEDIVEIVRMAAELGIQKVRITGGEPLTKPGIVDLCREIADVSGINEVSMTTNGILLPTMAMDLKKAGISRVNISLDTLNPQKYRTITRKGNFEEVINAIRAAEEAGMYPIKLNTVLIGGYNDDEIEDFVEITKTKDIEIRFIELMPIGEGANFPSEAFISAETILQRVPELEPIPHRQGVVRLYRLPNGKGRVGLISPISQHFCSSCNRVRLTADGRMKSCLHSSQEIPLKGLRGKELRHAICQAILEKPLKHELLSPAFPSQAGRFMNEIGG